MLDTAVLEQATGVSFEDALAQKGRDWHSVGRDNDLQMQLERFDLVGYVQGITGENVRPGVPLKDCPACGHHGCFVVYQNAGGPDTWACFSTSVSGNDGKNAGGTIIDFIMYTRGLPAKEATKVFLEEFCGEEIGSVPARKRDSAQKTDNPKTEGAPSKQKGGSKPPSVDQVVDAIEEEEGYLAIQFNVMESRPYVRGRLPWTKDYELRPFEDADRSQLYAAMQRRFYNVKAETLDHALQIVFQKRRFNPLVETLEGLRGTWDGVERIGHGLHLFLGAADDPYTNEAETLMFRAGLRRAYQPGCKWDIMPVLYGPQGIGKSSFGRNMALDDGFFTDCVRNIGTREAAELVQGKWVVEIAELVHMRNADVEKVKAWITQQRDDYRGSYGRYVTSRPRYFIIIGTTNSPQFLSDPSGNRRFMPIECGLTEPELPLTEMHEWMQQAWAEALARFSEDDDPLVPSDAMRAQLEEKQANATYEDPRIGIIEEWLNKPEIAKVGNRICAAQIVQECLETQKTDSGYKKLTNEVNEIMAYNFPQWRKSDGKKHMKGYGSQRVYELLPDVATLFEVGNEE